MCPFFFFTVVEVTFLETMMLYYPTRIESCFGTRSREHASHTTVFPSVPEEKYLTLEGFHKFAVDRAKQDIRSVWRAILACGYDLHFER